VKPGPGAGTETRELSGPVATISADSLYDAVSAVKGHPFLSRGGTPQVSQTVSP
jgi:hypothetical protein